MLESWRWLHSLHSTVNNRQVDWTQLDHVIDAAIAALPQLAGIEDAAPDATFRIRGQKPAREPHRYRPHGDARQHQRARTAPTAG